MEDPRSLYESALAYLDLVWEDKIFNSMVRFFGWAAIVLSGFLLLFWTTWMNVTHTSYPWPGDWLSFLSFTLELISTVGHAWLFFAYPIVGAIFLLLMASDSSFTKKKWLKWLCRFVGVAAICYASFFIYRLPHQARNVVFGSLFSLFVYVVVKKNFYVAVYPDRPSRKVTPESASTSFHYPAVFPPDEAGSPSRKNATKVYLGTRILSLFIAALYFFVSAATIAGVLSVDTKTINSIKESICNSMHLVSVIKTDKGTESGLLIKKDEHYTTLQRKDSSGVYERVEIAASSVQMIIDLQRFEDPDERAIAFHACK